MPKVKQLLAPKEVAARWRVHVGTIYRLIECGRLPAFRVFSLWRIRLDAVIAYEEPSEDPIP